MLRAKRDSRTVARQRRYALRLVLQVLLDAKWRLAGRRFRSLRLRDGNLLRQDYHLPFFYFPAFALELSRQRIPTRGADIVLLTFNFLWGKA